MNIDIGVVVALAKSFAIKYGGIGIKNIAK